MNPRDVEATRGFDEGVINLRGSDRHRSGDLSIFSRTLYQLSYRASGDPRNVRQKKYALRKEGLFIWRP